MKRPLLLLPLLAALSSFVQGCFVQRLPDGAIPTKRKLDSSWQLVPLVMPIHYRVVDETLKPLPRAQIEAWSDTLDSERPPQWTDGNGEAVILNRIDYDCGCTVSLPGHYPWHGKLYDGDLPPTNRFAILLQRLPESGTAMQKGWMAGTMRRGPGSTAPEKPLLYDFLAGDFLPPHGRHGKIADVRFSLEWTNDGPTNEWRVTMTFPNSLDGILQAEGPRDEIVNPDDFHLHSAPLDGYRTNMVFGGLDVTRRKPRADGGFVLLIEPIARDDAQSELAFRFRAQREGADIAGYYGLFEGPPRFQIRWEKGVDGTPSVGVARLDANYRINPERNSRNLADADILSLTREDVSKMYRAPHAESADRAE